MDFFVDNEAVDRIVLDKEKDIWVDIKARMSYGDQQKLVASYMQLDAMAKKGATVQSTLEVNLETGNLALLLINIKAWNLPGKGNKVASINEATVKLLTIDVASRLVDEINLRNESPKA